ncbi:PEBP-like protein [Pleomassaria siparia CBS 279.74]|uniref:PEBP-like protein n=1 Tax=Pleomassaria siparia CBS 279.74 TaxID=1314801 RepID=A0A6G1K6Z1_9PLEO|nr:PEBP-like protein [Pleomassaria siparia CBS 279.74]
MLFTTVAAILFAGTAFAQTPAGFAPAVNKTLDVYYGTTYITPGLLVKKSSVSKIPVIGVANATLTGKYLLAMIDIDAPGQGANAKRGTVLHALLTDWTASGATQNGSTLLTTKATGPASYFGPAPPAETPQHPHKYLFILHEQPANFAVPASQKAVVQSRLNIDWVKFIADAKLSEPLYANYLQVQSGDNTKRGMEFEA